MHQTKRMAIFAHYDKNEQIAPYVLYYLTELKKVSNKIIFVSASHLEEDELAKLESIATVVISEPHKEYDFGSYKRGVLSVSNELDQYDELILCNDSCFGPLYPFEQILEKGKKTKTDMWGILSDFKGESVCSFFLVLQPSVFRTEWFLRFMKNVKAERCKDLIVLKYEAGLSALVKQHGGKLGTLLDIEQLKNTKRTDVIKDLKRRQIPFKKFNFVPKKANWGVYDDNNFFLHQQDFPFIKKLTFTMPDVMFQVAYPWFLKEYPKKLISDYVGSCDNFNQAVDRVYWARRIKKLKRFVLRYKKTPCKISLKIFGMTIFSRKLRNTYARPDSDRVVITVGRDKEMYNRCVGNNPYMAEARHVFIDNTESNLGISQRYNHFLDTYDYRLPTWFVFCHEDWEIKQDLSFLNNLDKSCLYGPIGALFQDTPTQGAYWLYGQIIQSDKLGHSACRRGILLNKPHLVDTFDCQCLIVHSELVKKYHLRFDEKLFFDLYVEDFCIEAMEKNNVVSKAIQIACQHFSNGNIGPCFYEGMDYLNRKYAHPKKLYATTVCHQVIGEKNYQKKIKVKSPFHFHFFELRHTKKGKVIVRLMNLPILFYRQGKEPIRVIRKPNGRYYVYLFGLKLFSYRPKGFVPPKKPNIQKKPFLIPCTGKKVGVIYTCLTGGYDDLMVPTCVNENWNYICFTDNEALLKQKKLGPWQIKPLVFDKSTPSMNNRWHKMHPDILFPKEKVSVYIDSNIDILTDKLFKDIQMLPEDSYFAAPIHFARKCIYDEALECIAAKKDNPDVIEAQMQRFKSEGFPRKYGLTENNVLWRRHHDERVQKINHLWWHILTTESQRDQLSLMYVAWKLNLKITYLSNKNYRFDYKNFDVSVHNPSKKEMK